MGMASLKCATGHARTPIDSLCRVFGISTRSGSSTSSGASRWIPKQHGNGIAIRQLHLQSRSISSTARILLRRPNGVLTNHQRAFSTSRPHLIMKPTGRFKTMEQIKSRANLGPLTFKAALLFVFAGVAMVFYVREERARLERQKIAEQTKGMGRPKVGGPFELVDHNGNKFTSEDLKGKYALVYFGFTHCPDICPDELDKMADMIDRVKAECGEVLTPIMITCDPARDTPAVLRPYIKEFHPDIVALTGDWESIKQTCKAYRVYFSTPSNVEPGQDYLVDHSIYFYLMDPEGDFVEAIGRNFSAEQAGKVIRDHVNDWTGPLDRKPRKID